MVIEYPEKLFFKGSISSLESDFNLSIPYALIEDLLIGRSYLKHLESKFILQVRNNGTICFHTEREKQKELQIIKQKISRLYLSIMD